MRKLAIATLAVWFALMPAHAADPGMMKVESGYSVKETLDKFTAILESKGITVFARIDHSAGAKKIGTHLPPTELLLFGNPKLGTPLMKINREVGFDLPMRALAWLDDDGKVWLAVTNPRSLNQTYALAGADGVIEKMEAALKALTGQVKSEKE